MPNDPTIHFIGEDGANVYIEVQGSLLAVAFRQGPRQCPPAKRGVVGPFSRASRLRMLKRFARIDWAKTGRSTFATTTWRDELGRPGRETLNRFRSRFHDLVEELVGKETCGIWRVEWKQRLTGRYRTQYMPHLHYIYFDIKKIRKIDYEAAATAAMGWDGSLSVDLAEITSPRDLMTYVSKRLAYVAKPGSLDIDAYLRQVEPHRPWGVFRRPLYPFADRTHIRTVPGEFVAEIRRVARNAWAGVPIDETEGFTTFGPAGEEVRALIENFRLTDGSRPITLPVR